jgi:PAS domain S-box-containing protein
MRKQIPAIASEEESSSCPAIPSNATEIILDSISDGVFTVDNQWRITSFNRAAEEITGISREDAVGRHCWDVFRANMCEADCALRRTMRSGRPLVNTSTHLINTEKQRVPVIVSTAPLRDETGKIIGGVETFRDLSLVEELRNELDSRFKMGDMYSRSPLIHKIFTILPQIAESDCSVLIQGETGTGKELLARSVHELSLRREKPFIPINCGALPDTLLESELFGYKAGAFTGATRDRPGKFNAAEGGTLFLDEIGEISPAFQIRLLRVLHDGTFQPLGDTRSMTANVRIIAASNKNIVDMVAQETFRQDLFYRINVISLTLPPLRERKEDIPLLVERFITRLNRLRGKAITGMEPEALSVLMSYLYPGNIRELENIIEHGFVLCPGGDIKMAHLPESLKGKSPAPVSCDTMSTTLKVVEAQTILDTLRRNGYSRLAAAKELGMHKSTLFRKIKALGIDLPREDGRSQRG